ncbi:hypothetical protein AB9M75_04010 [Lactobacillus sp. AN1001]
MKKIIKYLQGGEYHEATVADVGDVDLLKTENKTDLVSAINEIFITGGQGGGRPDGYEELVEKVNAIDSSTNQNNESITNAAKEVENAKVKLAQIAEDIEKSKSRALIEAQKAAQKAVDDYNEARERLDKEIVEAQKQLAKDISDKQADIEKLNDEAGSLGKQLDTVRKNAEQTAEELSNAKLDFGETKKQVTDLENEVSQKLSSIDLDPLKEKVESIDSEVKQTKEDISQKVNKKDLDLLTGTVNDVKSKLDLTADKIESKVSRDTLEKNISDFEVKKANLFLGTRDWLNCTFNDKSLARVSSGTYKHTRVAALSSGGEITLRAERLTIGESYVVSVNARVNTGTAKIKVNDFGEMVTVDTKETNVTNRWLRYYIVFVVTSDVMDISFRGTDLENDAQLFLNKAKLERGTVAFPWEQNENDDYDRAEHTEARLTVYEDQISGVVKKQTDLGDRQTEMQTTLTQVADGVEANSKLIDKTKDGLVKEFEGKLSSTAKALTAEYTEKTNEALGQITDSGANLILNSSFSNEEDRLSKWQEISNKANIITDDNGLSWLKMSQSGLDRDNPIGAKTNYFLVKKGKITVALDVKVDSRLDNDKILSVEFFDENNQRVDFKTFTMSELGILNSSAGKQRGLIRVALDRTDVKKAAVKVTLIRNGSISVTNFLAKNSSIDDGAYTPAPEDTAEQTIKQNTKIDQNAREIQLKANKTEIDNKFVDMNNELRQEIVTQKEATLRVTNEGIENVTRKVETVRGLADNAQTTANRAQSVADSANATLGAYQKSTEASFKNLGDRIESEVSSVKSSVDNMQIGGRNYLQGTADFTWPGGIGDLNTPSKSIELFEDNIKMLHISNSKWGGVYTKWGGAFPSVQFQGGDEYTISFDARGSGTFETVKNESETSNPLSGVELTSYWKRYSVSGKINTMNKAFVIYFKAGYDVYLKCVKIEKGNKATDWSQAPEDIQKQLDSNKQAIETANSKFEQTTNGFHETVNSIKADLDGKITKNSNEIKSFDDKYSRELTSVRTDIGNIRIGGTNLLKDTTTEQEDVECPTTGWVNGRVFQTTQPLNERQYVLSFEARGDSDAQRMATFLWAAGLGGINVNQKSTSSSGEVFNHSDGQTFLTLTTEWKRYWVLYEIKPDNTRKEIIIGRRWSDSHPQGKIYIRKVKLEAGNKATDWSQAPEDIQKQLDSNKQATQQWAQNKIEETANSVKRTIESVNRKFETVGITNLVQNGYFPSDMSGWYDWTRIATHQFYYSGNKTLFELENSSQNEKTARTDNNRIKVKRNTDYLISFMGFASSNVKSMDVYVLGRKNGDTAEYTKVICPIASRVLPADRADYVTVTFNSGEIDEFYLRFDNNGSSNGKPASIFIGEITLREGSVVDIGGRNYLQGTADFTWPGGIGENLNPNKTIEDYQGNIKMLHISSNSYGGIYTRWGEAFPNVQFQVGDNYTLSFDAKGRGIFETVRNEGESNSGPLSSVSLTNDWKRYSVSGKINTMNKAFVIYFKAGYDVYLKCVKIEKGNKATDWSQAPEDIQKQLDSNKQAIENNRHKLEETDKKLESQFSTVEEYSRRLSTAESKIEQTSNGIESRVSRIVTDTTKRNGETQNLVYNSEFINKAEGWSNIGNNSAGTILFANNEFDNWYGSNGLAFRNSNKQDYLVSDSKRFRVYKGQRLSASVQLHVTDTITHGQCRAGLEIKFYANEKDSEIATSNQQTQFMYNIQNGQQKLLYCENVEVPANANYVAIRLYTFGVGNIIFNQPMLVSGDKIQPYKQDVRSMQERYNSLSTAVTTVSQKADSWGVRVVGLENSINNKVDKNKIITEINADTSGLKLSGSKIQITGNTIFNGDIQAQNIRLVGKSGLIGLDGNSGIIISSIDTAFQTRVTRFGMDFLTTTNGKKEVMGGITTGANADNGNLNGISIVLDTKQKLGDFYGGDFFSLGSTVGIDNNTGRRWDPAMLYDASGQVFGGGFKWNDQKMLAGMGRLTKIEGAHDPLLWRAMQFNDSTQTGFYQPTLSLGWGDSTVGSAGVSFLWDSIKPYGTVDMTGTRIRIKDAEADLRFSWVNWSDWNAKIPALIRDCGNGPAGIGIGADGNVILFGVGRRKALSQM